MRKHKAGLHKKRNVIFTKETGMSDEQRFAFGKNWKNYAKTLTREKVSDAERSLTEWLGADALKGKRFLDIGSGSGLFSLAAYRLGASEVFSFDYDNDSAECTASLKRRFAKDKGNWTVERGDVLDEDYISRFYGNYDIVYSWGVLHHTGNMKQALENAAKCVKDAPGSRLFIAIYNDQGELSNRWRRIKKFYCGLPEWGKRLFIGVVAFREFVLRDGFTFIKHPRYMMNIWKEGPVRGMNRFHDLVDWYGGYPFEVAKPEEILEFYQSRGFRIVKMKTCGGGLGCNELVFERV